MAATRRRSIDKYVAHFIWSPRYFAMSRGGASRYVARAHSDALVQLELVVIQERVTRVSARNEGYAAVVQHLQGSQHLPECRSVRELELLR